MPQETIEQLEARLKRLKRQAKKPKYPNPGRPKLDDSKKKISRSVSLSSGAWDRIDESPCANRSAKMERFIMSNCLYASIKQRSKYFDQANKTNFFPIVFRGSDGHCIRGNGNDYRREDLDIFTINQKGERVKI